MRDPETALVTIGLTELYRTQSDARPTRADDADEPTTQRRTETAPPIQRAAAQRDDYYDRLLRKTAEFDNYRKRIERERRELAGCGGRRSAAGAAAVVDDFERALKADAGAEASTPTARASS